MFIDVDPLIAAYIVITSLLVSSLLWVPVAFTAYAVGRRQYSLQALFAFVVVEAVSLAVAVTTFALNLVAKE